MANELPTRPPRFGVGAYVQEKKKDGRVGTIIKSIDKAKWEVEFEGGEKEHLTSGRIKFNNDAYAQKTPTKRNALNTIRKKIPTVSRRAKDKPTKYNELSSKSDDDEEASAYSSTDETPPSWRKQKSTPSSTTSSYSRVSQLLTPVSLSFGADDDDDDDDGDGEDYDDGFVVEDEDRRIELNEEDDDCRGTQYTSIDGDGNERVDFIDEPQKNAAYTASKQKMEKEKAKMIRNKQKFTVYTNPKKKYEVGGRVMGHTKFKEHAGKYGTITDVLDDNFYNVQWDDGTTCTNAKKTRDLRLSNEDPKEHEWEVVEDHIPDRPTSEYDNVGLIDFSPKVFNPENRERLQKTAEGKVIDDGKHPILPGKPSEDYK